MGRAAAARRHQARPRQPTVLGDVIGILRERTRPSRRRWPGATLHLDEHLLAKLRQRYDEPVAFGIAHNRHRDCTTATTRGSPGTDTPQGRYPDGAVFAAIPTLPPATESLLSAPSPAPSPATHGFPFRRTEPSTERQLLTQPLNGHGAIQMVPIAMSIGGGKKYTRSK